MRMFVRERFKDESSYIEYINIFKCIQPRIDISVMVTNMQEYLSTAFCNLRGTNFRQ